MGENTAGTDNIKNAPKLNIEICGLSLPGNSGDSGEHSPHDFLAVQQTILVPATILVIGYFQIFFMKMLTKIKINLTRKH